MDKFYFNWDGKQYLSVLIPFPEELGFGSPVTVSVESLWNDISDAVEDDDKEAVNIDNQIVFYLPDKFLENTPTETRIREYLVKELNAEGDYIKLIAYALIDGIEDEYNEEQIDFIIKRLKEIKNEEHLSLSQLEDLCWEDSTDMFDRIFG